MVIIKSSLITYYQISYIVLYNKMYIESKMTQNQANNNKLKK